MSKEIISSDEVGKIAELCKLQFNDQEFMILQDDLSKILEYIASLQEIDTKGIDPTFLVLAKKNVVAADQPEVSLSRAEVLKNAENKDSAYIRTGLVL